MIINAVSELPAIVINNIYEMSNEVDKKLNTTGNNYRNNINVQNKESATGIIISEQKKNNEVSYSDLANKLKGLLKDSDLSIEFSIDEEINKMIMKLVDDNNEVIQQFPPEIAIKIAKIIASTLGAGQVTDARI